MKKLTFVFLAAVSFAALGCKKKQGGDCAKAIQRSMELSKAEMEKLGTDAKTLQQMTELGVQHCKDDKWSADAIKCMIDAKAMTDSMGCYGKLTSEQQEKMNKAASEMGKGPHEVGSAGGGSDGAGSATGSDTGSAGSGGDTGSAGSGSAAPAAAGTGSGSAGSDAK